MFRNTMSLSALKAPSLLVSNNFFYCSSQAFFIENQTFSSKTVEQMALELRDKIGRNSVKFASADRMFHIDLAGRDHFDKSINAEIPTPHTHAAKIHANEENGKVNISKKAVIILPATKDDIRLARQLAK